MDRSNVISLISETWTQDEIGQSISTETPRQVFCDVRSVSRQEWFDAGRDGLKPAFVFVMFAPDYEGEKIVEYDGKRYGIYRTYVGRNERIELYVEEKGGIHEQQSSQNQSGSTGRAGEQDPEDLHG